MSQHDGIISNDTGANVRSDINNALSAIFTTHSGATEPSTTYAYQLWMDTSSNVLKIRNSANSAWYTLPISPVANNTVDINGGTVDGITSLTQTNVAADATDVELKYSGSTKLATTSTGIDVTGTVTADGLTVEKSAAAVSTLNRTTSDGDIQVFKKDGTTVGSIGIYNGNPYLASPTLGIRVSNALFPSNTTGAITDGACDIGGGSGRFKNLYLSGGVYLGGTGAANYLDDYEEGTWDPQIFYQNATNQAAAVNTGQNGYYVKIGQMVIVSGYLVWTAPSGLVDDNIGIKNLPFTSYANDGTIKNTCSLYVLGATSTPTNGYMGILYNNNTIVQITNQKDDGNYGNDIGTGTRTVGFTITYRVA